MDSLIAQEVAVIGALTSLVVAIVSLVKAVHSGGRATQALTVAEKTKADQVDSNASSRPEATP